jgi:diguanylate cyclase (GGDEF)-like protein
VQDARGIAFLSERIDSIERERDALLDKSQRLERLQRSFSEIIAAATEGELANATMRGAWLGIGFARVLWFSISSPSEIVALYEYDGESTSESEYGGTLPEASSLRRLIDELGDAATGLAADIDAPLFDTRRRYAASAVRPATGTAFVLYADGLPERADAWSVTSLRELATHASVALDRMRLSAELERLAMHDPLTGLLNRRAMMDRLRLELATARRTGFPVAFAMIDVDNFKAINDTRGHAGGDEALVQIAGALRAQTRETDVPVRFAGDEFALIMPRTDTATIATVMHRVYGALGALGLGISVGVAFDDGTVAPDALIARADSGVYESKRAGKNTYRVVAPDV